MNWFSTTSWLWRALRGQSVIAAAVFGLGILGLSVMRIFRHLLAALGVPWLLLIILPIVLIGMIGRREREWMPDEELRKRWSRRIIVGAIGLSLCLGLITAKPPPPHASAGDPSHEEPIRVHGPSGKKAN